MCELGQTVLFAWSWQSVLVHQQCECQLGDSNRRMTGAETEKLQCEAHDREAHNDTQSQGFGHYPDVLPGCDVPVELVPGMTVCKGVKGLVANELGTRLDPVKVVIERLSSRPEKIRVLSCSLPPVGRILSSQCLKGLFRWRAPAPHRDPENHPGSIQVYNERDQPM